MMDGWLDLYWAVKQIFTSPTSWVETGGLTLADVGVSDVSLWMLEVKRFTLLAVVSDRVVLTFVTNSAADVSRRHEHGHVEVTRVRVLVAVTL